MFIFPQFSYTLFFESKWKKKEMGKRRCMHFHSLANTVWNAAVRGNLTGWLPHSQQTKQSSHVTRARQGFDQRTSCTLGKQQILFSFLCGFSPCGVSVSLDCHSLWRSALCCGCKPSRKKQIAARPAWLCRPEWPPRTKPCCHTMPWALSSGTTSKDSKTEALTFRSFQDTKFPAP